MDLQKTAESESERRTRSKLEPHREAIFALRRKHWTYDQIAKWLKRARRFRHVHFRLPFLRAGHCPPATQCQIHLKPWRANRSQFHRQQNKPIRYRFKIDI